MFPCKLEDGLLPSPIPWVWCKLGAIPGVEGWFGDWRRRGISVADPKKGTMEWKVCLYHLFQKHWYVLKHLRELGMFLAPGTALHVFKNKNCWHFFQLSLVWIKALVSSISQHQQHQAGQQRYFSPACGISGVLGRKMRHLVFWQTSNLLFTEEKPGVAWWRVLCCTKLLIWKCCQSPAGWRAGRGLYLLGTLCSFAVLARGASSKDCSVQIVGISLGVRTPKV